MRGKHTRAELDWPEIRCRRLQGGPCEGDDHQIEIIQGKPYRRIAHVQASSTPFEGESLSWETLRRYLCKEAAVVGADGGAFQVEIEAAARELDRLLAPHLEPDAPAEH